jgi:hypothetical protein
MNNKFKRMCEEAVVPNLGYYPGICLECLRKTTQTISYDSWFLGRCFKAGPSGYGAGVPSHSIATLRSSLVSQSQRKNWPLLRPPCLSWLREESEYLQLNMQCYFNARKCTYCILLEYKYTRFVRKPIAQFCATCT